ncbi:MAG: MFS transporter [Candidatus Heimdallarchaeota archaeon]|nr:MAG: MFS transporter [Candidatus Heimdallarchaeota archaeon]
MAEMNDTSSKVPVLIAGVIGWAHDGFALVLVSLLATTISVAYGVDKIAIGFVFSAQYVMTVPGAALFGELADRFGRKNILLLSVLWDSIFTSLSAIAPTFEIFAILRLLSGLGVSWGISFSLLSETFSSEKRGAAGGLVHATFVVGYIGAVIVTLIFGNMDPITLGPLILDGWRICFLSALFPIPFLIYLEFALDESQVWTDYKKSVQLEDEVKPEKVRIFDILQGKWLKLTILLVLLFWLSEFAYHTLADWAPTYFEYLFTYELQNAGGDVDTAGTLAMVVMLGVMIIAAFALFTTGWLSDRIGRRNAFIGCSIIGLIGASIFFVSNFIVVFTPLIVIGCLVLTISFGMHGVFGVWSSEVYPTRIRATATSLIFSVARGLAWGAFFVGIVAETLEPTVSVLENPLGHAQALAVAMLACTFAYLAMLFVPRLIPETKGIDITAIQE